MVSLLVFVILQCDGANTPIAFENEFWLLPNIVYPNLFHMTILSISLWKEAKERKCWFACLLLTSKERWTNLFTKGHTSRCPHYIVCKLGMKDIYVPTWEQVSLITKNRERVLEYGILPFSNKNTYRWREISNILKLFVWISSFFF